MSAVRSVWSARITCRWMLYRHRRCGAVGSPILCRFRSARPPSAFCNSLRFSSTSSTPSPSSPSPRVREDTVRRLLDTCSNTSYHPLGVEPCKDLAVPTEGFREQLKQFWTGTKDMYHVGRQYFAIKWKSVVSFALVPSCDALICICTLAAAFSTVEGNACACVACQARATACTASHCLVRATHYRIRGPNCIRQGFPQGSSVVLSDTFAAGMY